jgi:DASS family divalent anion:Na+ symporter
MVTTKAVQAGEPAQRREAILRWVAVLLPGVVLYLAPLPALTAGQRHLAAIFAATIIALMVQPLPMGASVLLSMTLLALTGTVPVTRVLSGFGNSTVWMIFSALLFGHAVAASGFGARLAYLFIRRFGRSPLSLAYSIAVTDTVLAPFVPSDTSRGGAIIYPIARSVAQAFGSEPGPTAARMGRFLMMVGYHATYACSAMFLTSMASNPLIAEFARKIGHVELTWGLWARGAAVPGLLSLLLAPRVLFHLCPPEIRDTQPARRLAADELRRLGAMGWRERFLVVVLLCVMAGWITAPWHGLSNTAVALSGVCAMLVLGVLSWDDLLAERKLWDALIWFGGLVMMAGELNSAGVVNIVAGWFFPHLHGWPWLPALVALVCAYLYVHYAFASMTAQVVALYPAFLAAAIAHPIAPVIAVLPLAYFSSLNAGLTHYGTGSAPIFFAAGYVPQKMWWRIGFLMSLLNLAVWLGVGLIWWKVIGLW